MDHKVLIEETYQELVVWRIDGSGRDTGTELVTLGDGISSRGGHGGTLNEKVGEIIYKARDSSQEVNAELYHELNR